MKKCILLLFLSIFLTDISFGQKWNKVDNTSFRSLDEQRLVIPSKYESFELDFDHFKELIQDAPKRFESQEKGIDLNWPMPGGKMQQFTLKRSDVFHPDLAAKYPEIRAYTGHSIDDPTAILKISTLSAILNGFLES